MLLPADQGFLRRTKKPRLNEIPARHLLECYVRRTRRLRELHAARLGSAVRAPASPPWASIDGNKSSNSKDRRVGLLRPSPPPGLSA